MFDPLGIDEPVQVPETISVASHEKKKSRATHEELAKYVPITTIDLELEGAALHCPYCNTNMEDIGSKVVREEIVNGIIKVPTFGGENSPPCYA